MHNTAADDVDGLSFKATLYISDTVPFNGGQPIDMIVDSKYCGNNKCALPGSDVGQFRLELPLQDSGKKLSGYVWLDTPSGVRAEVLPLEVTPKPTGNIWKARLSPVFTPGSARVPGIALVFASLTAIVAFFSIGWTKWGKSVGEIALDFSKNWVSNVTAIAGLSGAVTALFTLDSAQILTKNTKFSEYAFLFALFALMLVVAPVIGKMLSTLFPAAKNSDETKVWVYVLTVGVVVWAAIGVLLTAVLYIAEGLFAGNISDPIAIGIVGGALVLGVLTCGYSWKKTTAFAGETTDLVEKITQSVVQQDAVTELLDNVRRVRAVEADKDEIVDVLTKLTDGVNRDVFGEIAGFEESGHSVKTALDEAIKKLGSTQADQETILDALKDGLLAVLTALKPNHDGRLKPPIDAQEAVTNLNVAVQKASEGTYNRDKIFGTMTRARRLTEAIIIPAPTPVPSRRVRPKVYLP